MKRVIEIDEALYKHIANSDMNNACGTIRARDATVIKAIADSEPLNEVLDKIRVEIEALSPEPTAYDLVDGNPIKDAVWETLAEVLQIIDNYKESEDK